MSLEGLRTARDLVEAEIKGLPDNNPKTAYGIVKQSYQHIPSTALRVQGTVHKLGADKYGSHNWRENSVSAMVYYEAIKRHLEDWKDGLTIDPESGVNQLGHIAACANILIDADENDCMIDDRPKLNKYKLNK